LNGVGSATANAIIRHRTEHGPFRTVDELLNVPGIGPEALEHLRPQVTV
jgi:competence protein ComEA